jgi:sugar phosphate isomerase/epimerase
MKLGIHTENFQDATSKFPIRDSLSADAYKHMKALGFDCADLTATSFPEGHFYHCDLETALEWARGERRRAEDAGIEIFQVHGAWPTDDTTPENRAEKLKLMERGIRLTHALGSKYFVLHPDMPYGWWSEPDPSFPDKTTTDMLLALLPIAVEEDVIICLENMPMTKLSLSRTPKMYNLVRQINHPNLGMCYDTGHGNVFGDDAGEMIRLIAPVLKVLHIHDNLGDKDAHLKLFEGNVNFEGFIHALRDIGFDGCFSIESMVGYKMDEPEFDETVTKLVENARKIINMP